MAIGKEYCSGEPMVRELGTATTQIRVFCQKAANRGLPRDQDVDIAAFYGIQHDVGRFFTVIVCNIECSGPQDHSAHLEARLNWRVTLKPTFNSFKIGESMLVMS